MPKGRPGSAGYRYRHGWVKKSEDLPEGMVIITSQGVTSSSPEPDAPNPPGMVVIVAKHEEVTSNAAAGQ